MCASVAPTARASSSPAPGCPSRSSPPTAHSVRWSPSDATWWSDGGGEVSAARRPVEGRDKVLRFLFGALEKWGAALRVAPVEVNGGPVLAAW